MRTFNGNSEDRKIMVIAPTVGSTRTPARPSARVCSGVEPMARLTVYRLEQDQVDQQMRNCHVHHQNKKGSELTKSEALWATACRRPLLGWPNVGELSNGTPNAVRW